MTTDTFLEKELAAIEGKLKELLAFPNAPEQELYEAASYSVLNGGKRLRPLLVLASCLSFGGDPEVALLPACALELVHCYSLIHDDLPAMDNDDFRRGKPSLHKHKDEGTAILAGDFLLTYAFELLAEAPLLSERTRLALILALARSAGGKGMVGGQLLDLKAGKGGADKEEQRQIHIKKTAELISCAFTFGAILAGKEEAACQKARAIGLDAGLAFQIQDDLQDNDASGSTFLAHYGIEGSKEKLLELKKGTSQALLTLSLKTPHLQSMTERMLP